MFHTKFALALSFMALVTGLYIAQGCGLIPPSLPHEETQQPIADDSANATNWTPSWDTGFATNGGTKAPPTRSVRFAEDGYHGSPVSFGAEQKSRNAQARDAIVRSFQRVPECSGVTLNSNADGSFLLQVFNGIDNRKGNLQWVLYRSGDSGKLAYGEGTGADSTQGQDGVTQSICSTINEAVAPRPPRVPRSEHEVMTPPSMAGWEATTNVLEPWLSHLHYKLPNGFSALSDATRKEENRKRYETQLTDALKKGGPNTEKHETVDGNEITHTQKTEVFPPYTLVFATHSAPKSSASNELPRINIYAQKRIAMLMEAADSVKMVNLVPQVKVLRGPEDVTITGQRFVRGDFQFRSGDFLSRFCTVYGDYLIEFDLRANSAIELEELVGSMKTVVFER